MVYKEQLIKLLKDHLDIDSVDIDESLFTIPPNHELGDVALPCFKFAAKLKKSPQEIANELKEKLAPYIADNEFISEINVAGPYLNFRFNPLLIAEKVILSIYNEKTNYGSSNIGKNNKALIEHTSINPNASPHLGRTRNSMIGDSIARLYRFQGYDTEVHYFVNDIGKQIAMLVYACKDKPDISFKELLDIYIQVNNELESNPELEKEIFTLLNKLENNDKEIIEQFKRVADICVKGQSALFKEFGITFDHYDYESKYLFNNITTEILAKLESTEKVFTDEAGRKVLDLQDYKLPMKTSVFVLTREDGTSLYGLRDIAYTIEKLERSPDNNVVVLGEDHKLYFKQLSAALDLLGYKAPDVVHYSFVLLKEGKMSTRKGNLVLLEDVMKKAKEKAYNEILKRNPNLDNDTLQHLAKVIGYGAIKYSILKISAEKNVTFDWDAALNFEGDSAPYIQYAHARIKSIIAKSDSEIATDIDFSIYNHHEIQLIKKLHDFVDIAKLATVQHKPHLIALYVYELAQMFNEYYHGNQVLCDNLELRKARLLLISCIAQVIKTALNLLGIEAPDRM